MGAKGNLTQTSMVVIENKDRVKIWEGGKSLVRITNIVRSERWAEFFVEVDGDEAAKVIGDSVVIAASKIVGLTKCTEVSQLDNHGAYRGVVAKVEVYSLKAPDLIRKSWPDLEYPGQEE